MAAVHGVKVYGIWGIIVMVIFILVSFLDLSLVPPLDEDLVGSEALCTCAFLKGRPEACLVGQ